MSTYTPADADYAQRVASSFGQQRAMTLIGASLTHIEPGLVEISLPFRPDLTQQHGFLHAGIVTAIVDSACGYAALSLMPRGTEVLSVEFKLNLLRPAAGERFLARGTVLKQGRTLTVVRGDVYAHSAGSSILIAAMQATIIGR